MKSNNYRKVTEGELVMEITKLIGPGDITK